MNKNKSKSIETAHAKLMLNLGCGVRTHVDWINIDWSLKLRFSKVPFLRQLTDCPVGVTIHDLRKGIPFGDATVDVVYSSHVLEHIQRGDARLFVQEMFRVLKPGGIIRIVVPDLESAARKYLDSLSAIRTEVADQAIIDQYEWSTIFLLDQMVRVTSGGEMLRWLKEHHDSGVIDSFEGTLKEIAKSASIGSPRKGLKKLIFDFFRPSNPSASGELHKWMYDEFSLQRLLQSCGFTYVKNMGYLESNIDAWPDFCLDNNPDFSVYQPDSIWMEGIKSFDGLIKVG